MMLSIDRRLNLEGSSSRLARQSLRNQKHISTTPFYVTRAARPINGHLVAWNQIEGSAGGKEVPSRGDVSVGCRVCREELVYPPPPTPTPHPPPPHPTSALERLRGRRASNTGDAYRLVGSCKLMQICKSPI